MQQFEHIADDMSHPPLPEDASAEQLKELLEKNKAAGSQLVERVEQMRLCNELEAEALKAQQWEVAMKKLKEAREQMAVEHEKQMQELEKLTEAAQGKAKSDAADWLKTQIEGLTKSDEDAKRAEEERQREKALKVAELTKQQEHIQAQLRELNCDNPTGTPDSTQSLLLNQLKAALSTKKEDPNKLLLKALSSTHNKTQDPSGVNIIRPEVAHRLLSGTSTMEEWLASLNRQEEGELEVTSMGSGCNAEGGECRHGKAKSGMLDKPTTTVLHKQVWPQRNLGEDWAEDEIDFKHIKFEHLVAGETRTIETCTEPAQILGRLKLLRRIAYLKLRGFKWHLLRKMYAAILSSIETRENSWESNFDRFENILYRRAIGEHKPNLETRTDNSGRKRFCKDYNRPEGCPKSSPHSVWMGNGPNATKKLVYHYCAACLIRDKVPKEHPEGHPQCPHKA